MNTRYVTAVVLTLAALSCSHVQPVTCRCWYEALDGACADPPDGPCPVGKAPKARAEQLHDVLSGCDCIRLRKQQTVDGAEFGCEDSYLAGDAAAKKGECESRTSAARGFVRWRDFWEHVMATAEARQPWHQLAACTGTIELARITMFQSSSCSGNEDCVSVDANDNRGIGCRVWINRDRALGVSAVVEREHEDLQKLGCVVPNDKCDATTAQPGICAQGKCVPADWPVDCPQAMKFSSRLRLPYGLFDLSRSTCDARNKALPSIAELGVDSNWFTWRSGSACKPCTTIEGPDPKCHDCSMGRQLGSVKLTRLEASVRNPAFLQAQLFFDTPGIPPDLDIIEQEVAAVLEVPRPTGTLGERYLDLREGRLHFGTHGVFFVPFPADDDW